MTMTKPDSCNIRNFYKFSEVSDRNSLARDSVLKLL